MDDGPVDVDDPRFPSWVNQRFRALLQPAPDAAATPCLAADGRVKQRGQWDSGPAFAAREAFSHMRHQELVRDFFAEASPCRGLMLFHSLGSGKTCTAIGVAERAKARRQIVVLSPASLKGSFMRELETCGSFPKTLSAAALRQEIRKKYLFVSYDAPNTAAALAALPDLLNNKLVIVDEAHNLVSMVLSGAPKGVALFNAIMTASNLRLLLLSGTPVINDPFELGILGTLLRGYMDKQRRPLASLAGVPEGGRYSLFTDSAQFHAMFVDGTDPRRPAMKNTLALKARLVGLFSFYGGMQPEGAVLPAVRARTVLVNMSQRQYDMYEKARKLERVAEKRQRQKLMRNSSGADARRAVDLRLLFSAQKDGAKLSNFRAFSRQFCNFAFPADVPRYLPRLGDINLLDADAQLPAAALVDDAGLDAPGDLARYSPAERARNAQSLQLLEQGGDLFLRRDLATQSPKFAAMLANLEASPGSAFIYSQFREMEGVGVFALTLLANGYVEYGWRDAAVRQTDRMAPQAHTRDAETGRTWGSLRTAAERRRFRPLAFMVWAVSSGRNDRREHLLNVFNSDENRRGGVIRAFLATKAGAEGINLMNVRQVHIMEPYWNAVRVRQAVGRAVRYCSHATLPPGERSVEVLHYVSTVRGFDCPDVDAAGRPESTDEYVLSIAERKQAVLGDVEHLLKEVAFDCSLNAAHTRAGLARPLQCFQGTGVAAQLDPAQDRTDAEVLKDKALVRLRLRAVKLAGEWYRLTAADAETATRHHRGLFEEGERRELHIYDRLDNRVVGTLVLVHGRRRQLDLQGAAARPQDRLRPVD